MCGTDADIFLKTNNVLLKFTREFHQLNMVMFFYTSESGMNGPFLHSTKLVAAAPTKRRDADILPPCKWMHNSRNVRNWPYLKPQTKIDRHGKVKSTYVLQFQQVCFL